MASGTGVVTFSQLRAMQEGKEASGAGGSSGSWAPSNGGSSGSAAPAAGGSSGSSAPAAGGSSGSSAPAFFEPSSSFQGAREGMCFKLGHLGLGYYKDTAAPSADAEAEKQLEKLRPQLPETWSNCKSLRQERLKVDATAGAGLSLERSDFGFAVVGVKDAPGQDVAKGDVIVAVEGRILAGLSAPQMQASFQKRRVNGSRMQVASLEEVDYLSKQDPSIIECWDAANQRVYYFNKKTAKSGWTREELQVVEEDPAEAKAKAAPIDLATFFSHGFSAPKEPTKKKKKVPASAQPNPNAGKDESDLARDERQRWNAWNEGGQGGYTEQFFEKYKNCQSNPAKPKKAKILQGSVGPGNGMEYMARWTGSKNSFN